MDAKEARAYINGATAYSATTRRTRGPLIICAVAAFICFTIFFSTSSVQDVSKIAKDAAHNLPQPHIPSIPSIPEIHNPFKSSAHKPPIQSNSSSGTTKWHSDWKWLHPFSSSVTFDEDRVVLPPLQDRLFIYTYYEPTSGDAAVLEEEKKILTLWRKAWWAQGFKPIILGTKEAIKNELYERLQNRRLDEGTKNELMKWLAWGWMGEGILTNWLLLPMAPYNDPDLIFLRSGKYGDNLVRYEAMGNGIYASPSKDSINSAIKAALDNPTLDKQTHIQDAIPNQRAFTVQVQPTALAIYDIHSLTENYPSVATDIDRDQVSGLKSLQLLMTSHLHGTFLEQFSTGIAILNPESVRTTILASLSVQLAHILNKCSNSPVPGSCPPNRPDCRPCKALPLSYITELSNDTKTFTIGTIPHPYTSAMLQLSRSDIDVPWVRRHSDRDQWITRVSETLSKGLSAYTRIITFKNLIAHDETRHTSIWHSAERDWSWKDLEWHFGFTFPSPDVESGSKAKILPAPEVLSLLEPTANDDPPQLGDLLRNLKAKRPTRAALAEQATLVKKAKDILNQEKFKGPVNMVKVVEAWNLADTEAWRFVTALAAREHVQRARWEEDEKAFLGGEGEQ